MNYGKDDPEMLTIEESERRERAKRRGEWCSKCSSTGKVDGHTCLACNGTCGKSR